MGKDRRLLPLLLFSFLSMIVAGTFYRVAAQSEDEVWTLPLNLSQTGVAAGPIAVKDNNDQFHVLWREPSEGYLYSSGRDESWSRPAALRLPFSEPAFALPSDVTEDTPDAFETLYTPHLTADNNQRLHAFWRSDENRLFYSRVLVTDVITPTAWTARQQLAQEAVTQHMISGPDGRLHLAYIRTISGNGFPAGIYYRQSSDGGDTWTDSQLVYESSYFKALSAEQANLQLAADDRGGVHLVWDNPFLDTVFIAHSPVGGAIWGSPVKIDSRGPEDAPEAAGPSKIRIVTNGNEIHLTWQAQHEVAACAQYHQWSADDGATWQADTAIEDAEGCPMDGSWVVRSQNQFFLLTSYPAAVYLQVWDGSRWSEPEAQSPLISFTHPETYRQVEYRCQRAFVTADSHLTVIGCGKGIGEDVWLISRSLASLEEWFLAPTATPIWRPPDVISESEFALLPPAAVVAADSRLHVMWNQSGDPVNLTSVAAAENEAEQTIYYSRLDADRWLPPRPHLNSPTGRAGQPAAAADEQGNLYVVWAAADTGEIYFSRAVAEHAVSVSEWLLPVPLTTPGSSTGQPDIVVDGAGLISVFYNIPLNEDRGIYMKQSADAGGSWSESGLIFNGAEAGWQQVGPPQVALGNDDQLHLLWTRKAAGSTGTAQALFYARSEDGGQSWSDVEVVAQTPLKWSKMVSGAGQTWHRSWLSAAADEFVLWHQFSLDNGRSWSEPVEIADSSYQDGPVDLIVDPAAEPHLLQVLKDIGGELKLQEWVWDGTRWQVGEELALPAELKQANSVTMVILPDSRLALLYSGFFLDETNERWLSGLFATNRIWESPVEFPTPLPTLTPTPAPVIPETPTPGPSPTPTLAFSTAADNTGRSQIGPFDTTDPVGGIAVGVLPALFLILAVVVIGLRFVRSR